MVELLTNLNIIIGACYFLLSLLILLAPFGVKTLRVLGIWGLIMALHAVMFLTGCGWHHLDIADGFIEGYVVLEHAGWHFLIHSLMQVYGAMVVAAIAVFRGRDMMDRMKARLVQVDKKKDV